MVSYAVRFPELAAKSKSIAGEVDMDPQTVELDRGRLLAVERLILETISFNFTSRMPFPYIIKMTRAFGGKCNLPLVTFYSNTFHPVPKKLSKLAWRLAIDRYGCVITSCATCVANKCHSFRTLVNLSYPPHVIALACLYLSALLSSFEQVPTPAQPSCRTAHELAETLGRRGNWETKFHCQVEDLEGAPRISLILFTVSTYRPVPYQK